MKTPEEIALIGGGILLSSGLVFGLRGTTASTLPSVEQAVSSTMQGRSQDSQFDKNFQQAQKSNLRTGTWGTSKYYIDKNNNMHIGSGTLSGPIIKLLGDKTVQCLKTINIDDAVTAPQDSNRLFSTDTSYWGLDYNLTAINGLNKVDTSNVQNMDNILGGNASVTNLDVSNWNTSNVNYAPGMFWEDRSLTSLDLSSWNTSKLGSNDLYTLSDDNNLSKIILGNNNAINYNDMGNINWSNDGKKLSTPQLLDGNVHPGTWYKQ